MPKNWPETWPHGDLRVHQACAFDGSKYWSDVDLIAPYNELLFRVERYEAGNELHPDEIKDWLQQLDDRLSAVEEQVPLCPVCEGRGEVPYEFYLTVEGPAVSAREQSPQVCRTCKGRGILLLYEVSGPKTLDLPEKP